jgi:hypothetical protein
MRTVELSDPAATRAQLQNLVNDGYFALHGAPVRGLKVLRPSTTRFTIFNDKTSEVLYNEKLLCGSDDVSYATFFAAAHAPAREGRIAQNIPRKILG